MSESNQALTRYLLGELSEAECSALEQRYFTDPALFDQIVEVENELADDYARGRLDVQTRQRFETHYLNHPQRRERADFARALAAKIDRPVVRDSTRHESWVARLAASIQRPKLAWAFAAALLLLCVAAVWFALQTRNLRRQLAEMEAERARQEHSQRDLNQQLADERARADRLNDELNRAQSPTPPTSSSPAPVATLVLAIAGVRSGQTGPPARLVIPTGTEQARFQLQLSSNDYSSYDILIQTADGRQIFKTGGLRAKGARAATLVATVPANKFSSGDYLLTLQGATPGGEVEDVSKSLFRVDKK